MAQRTYGVILILICVLIVVMAAQGTTPEERDVTAILFLLPLGIYAIFTKQKIFYDSSPEP